MRERTAFWSVAVPAFGWFFWWMDRIGWPLCGVIRHHARTDTRAGCAWFTLGLLGVAAGFWVHIVKPFSSPLFRTPKEPA